MDRADLRDSFYGFVMFAVVVHGTIFENRNAHDSGKTLCLEIT